MTRATSYVLSGGVVATAAWFLACSSSSGLKTAAASGSPSASSTATASGPAPTLPTASPKTALPSLPPVLNVNAVTSGDGVNITFEPVEGARDYRVFPLPKDGDISIAPDGRVTIRDAIYRCAGDRQTPPALTDGQPPEQGAAVRTLVDNQKVGDFTRTMADATLGYVYVTPGAGRVPVYALGDPDESGDNDCFHQRWKESRVKRYVTSEAQRADLLRQRWRDDGVAFFVPTSTGSGTREVFTAEDKVARYYFAEGPEAIDRATKEPVFRVLTSPAGAESKPLMRVFYQSACSEAHDELVAGKARFERARWQGDALPEFNLHWAGLTGPTTLVVEALDQGCPYQGMLAPQSSPATKDGDITYPRWMTADDLKAASPTHEAYVNGQHEPTNRPRALARSFVSVTPTPKPDMDWFSDFGPGFSLGTFHDLPCGEPAPGTCWAQYHRKSEFADVDFVFTSGHYALAPMLGELWVVYGDAGADTGAKFRLTPNKKAQMQADSFLHVTMEADSYTTGRRYPQILVSDQDPPIQWTQPKGNTIIVQTFPAAGTASWPYRYMLEVCDHRPWDVSNQCPDFRDFHYQPGTKNLAPNPEVGERTGIDRSTRYDAYLSTRRAYLFLDGEPYGCANFKGGVPKGPVTVTFGDVLYHSGVDIGVRKFHEAHLKIEMRRHFDNLGFKSGVAAPSWDETRLPCVSD